MRALDYQAALNLAIEAALAAGELLRADFHGEGGPRGHGSHAEVDEEAERLIHERLLTSTPYSFLGEETGFEAGAVRALVWVVDPNDGTASFLKGMRGSAVSIGLLHEGEPVLGVVYSPLAPDDDGDLIAWAEGCPLTRNGRALEVDLRQASLDRGSIVFVSQDADRNSEANALLLGAGVRYRSMPSIAYRLALVAAGEGVAATSLNGPVSWDYAGANALLRGAGGVLIDAHGHPVTYTREGRSTCAGRCFGGAPSVAAALADRPWRQVFSPGRSLASAVLSRLSPGQHSREAQRLSRAQGCLLAGLSAEGLGSAAEFKSTKVTQESYPEGLRDLWEPNPVWQILAGQPTDDGELTLALARTCVREGGFKAEAVLDSYVEWIESGPFDLGTTTSAALRAAARAPKGKGRVQAAARAARSNSQANGSLMRVSPLGILGWRDPALAAEWARQDSRLTHPHAVCVESCAAYVAAIASAIGQGTSARETYEVALNEAERGGNQAVIAALLAAADSPPERFDGPDSGWVLLALRNAFHQLLRADTLEEAVVWTASQGGDSDTTCIIAGALLGSVHGREAVPARWAEAVLTCRPIVEAGARVPRPPTYWPVDVLQLGERLLLVNATRQR